MTWPTHPGHSRGRQSGFPEPKAGCATPQTVTRNLTPHATTTPTASRRGAPRPTQSATPRPLLQRNPLRVHRRARRPHELAATMDERSGLKQAHAVLHRGPVT
jgi:hypothetical protein